MILQEYKNRYGLLVLLDTFQGMEVHEHCSKGNKLRGSQQTGRDRVSLSGKTMSRVKPCEKGFVFIHSLQTMAHLAFVMTWRLMSFYNG